MLTIGLPIRRASPLADTSESTPHPGAVQVLLRAARGEAPHRTDRTDWTERQAPQRDVPRPGQRREPPVPTRPTGRPRTTGARPSRLAVAVLGALSVVGVGVAGVAAGSTAVASRSTPQRGPGSVVEPAGAGFLPTRMAPIDWTRTTISSRVPVDLAVARR